MKENAIFLNLIFRVRFDFFQNAILWNEGRDKKMNRPKIIQTGESWRVGFFSPLLKKT